MTIINKNVPSYTLKCGLEEDAGPIRPYKIGVRTDVLSSLFRRGPL
jgi:hypothetical protein